MSIESDVAKPSAIREGGLFTKILLCLTAAFTAMSLSTLAVGLRFNPLYPPVEGCLPSDGGLGLLGLAFIYTLGLLASYLIAPRGALDWLERTVVALGLGSGLISLITMLLGIFNLLRMTYMATSLIITYLALIAMLPLRSGVVARRNTFKVNRSTAAIAALLTLHLAIASYQAAAYPAVEWDSLAYGVNYARLIFQHGGIPVIAGTSLGLEMSAAYPPGLQCLACFLYVLAGSSHDFYYRILQPIFAAGLLALTYKASLLLTKRESYGLLGVLALAATPLFWVLAVLESYIMYLAFITTSSLYFLLKSYEAGKSTELTEIYETLSSIFAGFASLISYLGLSCICLLLIYSLHVRLRPSRAIKLTLLAALIASPWYIRNLVLLGNPVYPFLGVGIRINSLLWRSSTLHFSNYRTMWHVMDLLGLLLQPYKWREHLGAVILLSMTAYPAVHLRLLGRRKGLYLSLYAYTLTMFLAIFLFHALFGRYLLIFTPLYAILLAYTASLLFKKRSRACRVLLATLIASSYIYSLAFTSTLKTPSTPVTDKWSYLELSYPEASAWRWINENTPKEAKVATFDIRTYYLEREVFPLDGYEASPLYSMDSVEEALNYLEERGVRFVLSVPWASPLDPRMPPAYRWNPISKDLGDPRLLPPVYVSPNGAAIYWLKGKEVNRLLVNGLSVTLLTPWRELKVDLQVTNDTQPPTGRLYVAIPCDYAGKVLEVSVNSSQHIVSLEVFKGLIPVNEARWWTTHPMLARSPPLREGLGTLNPRLKWTINEAGYLTIMVVSWDQRWESAFNVTLYVKITS